MVVPGSVLWRSATESITSQKKPGPANRNNHNRYICRLYSEMKRVAVIGAGAAGLAALRRLAAQPGKFTAVAFEQTEHVGGTWVYTEQTERGQDARPLHNSMYKNLRTNLPKEVMAFPGFPFDSKLPSFMMHQDVNEYLDKFADEYDLRKYIQFQTSVLRVHPSHKSDGLEWEVTTKTTGTGPESNMFDAVMVCNGHYSVPLAPDFPGMNSFNGEVLHSHNYRHPETYTDKVVLCLGTGASGQDICLDLAPYCKHLYLCSRKPAIKSPLPANITQKCGVKSLHGDKVTLENGEELDIDVLLLCTGYKYTFPFLTPECGVSVVDERVFPMYKHIIHPGHPSLSFIGLCKTVCPFPQFDLQVRFAIAALDGSMVLPTEEEMYADIDKDYQGRLAAGMPHRHAHHMGDAQWQYNDMIADLAHLPRLPVVVNKLYNHVHALRRSVLTEYKTFNYTLQDDENFNQLTV